MLDNSFLLISRYAALPVAIYTEFQECLKSHTSLGMGFVRNIPYTSFSLGTLYWGITSQCHLREEKEKKKKN